MAAQFFWTYQLPEEYLHTCPVLDQWTQPHSFRSLLTLLEHSIQHFHLMTINWKCLVSFQFIIITTLNNKPNPLTAGYLTLRIRNGRLKSILMACHSPYPSINSFSKSLSKFECEVLSIYARKEKNKNKTFNKITIILFPAPLNFHFTTL